MSISAKKLKKLPVAPGVYFFLGPKTLKATPYGKLSTQKSGKSVEKSLKATPYGRRVLYIGKAGSLRDRVRSYFSRDIVETRGMGITQMVARAEDIHFQKTDSVLEAVLLEAELIREYQPKYNVREKDDKSFNYVVITKEDFPRVLLIRGHELFLKANSYFQAGERNGKMKFSHFRAAKKTSLSYKLKARFGPFPRGGTLRSALAIIRKIFPYRDKCTPVRHSNILPYLAEPTGCRQNVRIRKRKNIAVNHSNVLKNIRIDSLVIEKGRNQSKPCFNRQIGLCPGVCTGEISKKEYAKTICNIALLFRGKKKAVLCALARGMKTAAKQQEFERAAKLRNTMFALEHIQDVSLLKREHRISESHAINVRSDFYRVGEIQRIEAYDVAHTSGKEIVGVMVVMQNGEPDKDAYRKFVLRTVLSSNDTAALKEVLERRLTHAEWPFPELVVVDGGKAQLNAVTRVLDEAGVPAAIVGVVKDEYHRPKKIIGDYEARTKFEDEILLANHEAHRFAISFHRERMRKR